MIVGSPETAESPIPSPHNTSNLNSQNQAVYEIPIEIVSGEEMALIDAAFAIATTRSSLFLPTQFQRNARSIRSISLLSKRRLSTEADSVHDIEDFGADFRRTHKRNRANGSLLHQFRRKRGLFVTDITASATSSMAIQLKITRKEWCEKQTEFSFVLGKPGANKAMKAGKARHAILEQEIIQRVKVRVETDEDVWALKIMNFIQGANQLQSDGLTREMPLICFSEGVWMVGVIDEIRMPVTNTERNLTLVETKTRSQDALPLEPQRRNGRLQLMCYKYLWDNLVADKFPYIQFFDFFSLNPHYILCEDIRVNTAKSGFPAQTLDDLVRYYQSTCSMLPLAHDQLLLRYESQKDYSLIGEDQFAFDSDWVKGQIKCSLEFWRGERNATYLPEEERWKCKFCGFVSQCPINTTTTEDMPSQLT